jgi:hypothetical protein
VIPLMRSYRIRTRVRALVIAMVVAGIGGISACAEKGLLVPSGKATKMMIQVSITSADQQTGFGPRYLLAAAGFDGEDGNGNDEEDGGLLGYQVIPYRAGDVTLQVEVNLAPCFAFAARKKRGTCPLLIGAAIVSDTSFVTDTIGDPFSNAFDFYFEGPFEIGPSGTLPRVPLINLSASRFGVVTWEPDEALRVGGPNTPSSIQSAITGVTAPGGAVTLFETSLGPIFTSTPGQFGQIQGPYPQLSILENGAWRRVNATVLGISGSTFSSVAAISATEVYMGHGSGLYRYDGTSIAKVAAVTDDVVGLGSLVTTTGQKLVIAGTSTGFAWIGDGTTFTRLSVAGSGQRIDGVCITGPNEAFASSSTGNGLFRYNGTAWASVPSTFNGSKGELQCPGPGQAFVISSGQAILSWNGTTWTTLPGGNAFGGRLVDIGVVSPTEMYAAGDSAAVERTYYRFNGQTWQEITRKRFTNAGGTIATRRLWADPRGGAAYYGNSGSFARVERVTPAGVTVVSYQPSWRDVFMTSPTSAFAVGWNMLLARWDGVKWNFDPSPPRTQSVRVMNGVWSNGPNNAWAVGGATTIYQFNGTAWNVVSDNVAPITGVLENYNGVWGSGSDVWIAGARGIVRCRSTSNCVTEHSSPDTLTSIWGSGPNNIFAVGQRGKILRFNGTTWSEMTSPTTRYLARVHGSSADNVWALGDTVMLRFNGLEWKNVPFTDESQRLKSRAPLGGNSPFQLGLFVRSPTEVYLGGDAGIARWDGKEWHEMRTGTWQRRVLGITMAPTGCGFAILDGLNDLPAANLYRGIGPSGCLSAPLPATTNWP